MKKITKGAIAAGAAALLLAGGAGTFMSWNDEVVDTQHAITAGTLKLEEVSSVWTLNNPENVVGDITAVKIVPGDVLTFTQIVNYETVGESISAALTVEEASITAVGIEGEALKNQLLDAITVEVKDTVGETLIADGTGRYIIEGDKAGTLQLNANLAFSGNVEEISNASKEGSISFKDLGITFQQMDGSGL